MSEFDALYQEVILDHYKHPRNWGTLEGPGTRHVAGHNPLCGDRMTVHMDVADDVIRDIRIDGTGCAISVASASLMSETLKGKSRAEAEALIDKLHNLVTGKTPPGGDLGKLAVLGGVSKYPARVKCASLAWHTARAALEDQTETVTTE